MHCLSSQAQNLIFTSHEIRSLKFSYLGLISHLSLFATASCLGHRQNKKSSKGCKKNFKKNFAQYLMTKQGQSCWQTDLFNTCFRTKTEKSTSYSIISCTIAHLGFESQKSNLLALSLQHSQWSKNNINDCYEILVKSRLWVG